MTSAYDGRLHGAGRGSAGGAGRSLAPIVAIVSAMLFAA